MEKHKEMKKIELIAELSWCHMGDMDLAFNMISSAAKSGADYVKFQTWNVKNLKDGPWNEDGRRDIYEKAELSEEKHLLLKDICEKHEVKFLTSCFNINDLEFIRTLSNEVKIPGVESRNKELVNSALDLFDRVFVSTGTSSLEEVEYIESHINYKNAVLMHCVSVYPCPSELVNINRMKKMISKFKSPIGYSGHYKGIWDAILAINDGAVVIEKHFTIDNDLPGRDNKFALLPSEFKKIKEYALEREKMYYLNMDCFLKEEEEGRNIYTGRWNG